MPYAADLYSWSMGCSMLGSEWDRYTTPLPYLELRGPHRSREESNGKIHCTHELTGLGTARTRPRQDQASEKLAWTGKGATKAHP